MSSGAVHLGASHQSLRDVERALKADDLPAAALLAQQALELGHVHPILFLTRGCWRKHNGRLVEALDDLQRAHTLAPKAADILIELAGCLVELGRPRLAILACGDALAIDATRARAWMHKAEAHELLGQIDRAREAHLKALNLDNSLVTSFTRLANLYAQQGRSDEARALATRALALAPGHPPAVLAQARADLADHFLDDAEERLAWLIAHAGNDRSLRAIALGLLGDLRDLQDRTREAFAAYRDAGSLYRTLQGPGTETGFEQVHRVALGIQSLPPQVWARP